MDAPVGSSFAAKVLNPKFVEQHPWSPLISYVKREKRYKPKDRKTVFKNRPIMFASHRDACILSRYSDDILIVCPVAAETKITAALEDALSGVKLQLATDKTDRAIFDPSDPEVVQYLGSIYAQRGQ